MYFYVRGNKGVEYLLNDVSERILSLYLMVVAFSTQNAPFILLTST
jgi:hypothetical protein